MREGDRGAIAHIICGRTGKSARIAERLDMAGDINGNKGAKTETPGDSGTEA